MKEIFLDPINPDNERIEILAKEIEKQFNEQLYIPLYNILRKSRAVINTADDLLAAIKSEKIKFYRGLFVGKFNSSVARELKKLGAKWSRRHGGFQIKLSSLPIDIKDAISVAEYTYLRKMQRLDKQLADIDPTFKGAKPIQRILDGQMFKVQSDIEKTLQNLIVTPRFSLEQKDRLLKEYTTNMGKYIQGWTEAEIKRLRKRIKSHTLKGLRYEDMISTIERSYGVGRNKAKFLARQETNLLVSKFKELRYNEVGVNEYKWVTVVGSPAHPVRETHKALNGTIQRFDRPPISEANGDRNNPGEGFNCRCTARPLVRF